MSVGSIGGRVVETGNVESRAVRARTPSEAIEAMAEEARREAMPSTEEKLAARRVAGADQSVEGISPHYKNVYYVDKTGNLKYATVVTDSTYTGPSVDITA